MHLTAAHPPPAKGKRRIVFVADDLGLTAGANEGVARAVEAGTIRETSIVVTGAAAEEGAALARSWAGRIGTGLHLSLTDDRPVSGRIPGLTGPDGSLPPIRQAWRALRAGRPDRAQLEREVRAQIARAEDLGLPVGHLDGHYHVHAFPGVRDAVVRVVADLGIPWVRIPAEGRAAGGRFSAKRIVLARLGMALRAGLTAAGTGARSLPFTGLALFRRADYPQRFFPALDRLPGAETEWMLHPSTDDARLAAELSIFTDPSLPGRLAARGVRAVRYEELSE